jgi:tetratricopeptide (TPR) repeat protein
LSIFSPRETVTKELIKQVVEENNISRRLDELVSRGILKKYIDQEAEGIHYSFYHDLFRVYIYSNKLEDPKKTRWHKKVVKDYTSKIKENPTQELMDNCFYHIEEIGDKETIYKMAKEFGEISSENVGYYSNRNYFEKAIEYIEKVEKQFPTYADKQKEKISLLYNLMETYRILTEFEISIERSKEAIKIAKEIGDIKTEINVYSNIGLIYLWRGELEESFKIYNKLLSDYKLDKKDKAITLNRLSVAYYFNGKIKSALDCFNKVFNLCGDIGYKKGIANALTNKGLVYWSIGRLDEALKYYEAAMEVSRNNGIKWLVPIIYDNSGLVYLEKGEIDKAIKNYDRSSDILEEIGEMQEMGYHFVGYGDIHVQKEDYGKALDYYEKASKSPTLQVKICSLRGLGVVYKKRKELGKSGRYFQESLKLAKGTGFKVDEAKTRKEFGKFYIEINKKEKAGEHLTEARELFQEIGNEREVKEVDKLLNSIRKTEL